MRMLCAVLLAVLESPSQRPRTMTRQAFESAKELALELPEPERAELASTLVASLDGPPDPDAERLWNEEIFRRLEQIDRGDANFVTTEEVLARIRSRLQKI